MRTKSLLKLIVSSFIVCSVHYVSAGKLYWVGSTGTWDGNSTANWSLTSNGLGGATAPSVTDTVYFDKYSFPGQSFSTGDLTINGTVQCHMIDLSNLPDTVNFNVITINTATIQFNGGINLSSQHKNNQFAFDGFNGQYEFLAPFGTYTLCFGNGYGLIENIKFTGGATYNLVSSLNAKNLMIQNGTVLNTQDNAINFVNFMNTGGVVNAGTSFFTFNPSNGPGGQWYINPPTNTSDFSQAEILINGYNQSGPFYFNGGTLSYGTLRVYTGNTVVYNTDGVVSDIMLEGYNAKLKINPGDSVNFKNITSHTGYTAASGHGQVDTAYISRTSLGPNPVLYDVDGGSNCMYFTKIDSVDASGPAGTSYYTTNGFVSGSISSDYVSVSPLQYVISDYAPSCTGGVDGKEVVIISGGNGPYDVKWSGYSVVGDYVLVTHHNSIVTYDTLYTKIGGSYYDLEISDSYCQLNSEGISIPTAVSSGPMFEGYVLSGTDTLGFGHVNVFYDDGSGKFLLIDQYSFDGTYFTTNKGSAGNYVLQYDPGINSDSLMPTYYAYMNSADSGMFYWDNAYVFSNVLCGSTTTLNIHVMKSAPMNGNGLISGAVYESTGYGMKYGEGSYHVLAQGIANIRIGLGKQPSGQMIASTTTDPNGVYSFDSIPSGTYMVYTDITGLEMQSTYTITINANDTMFTFMDFFADSTKIDTAQAVVTGIAKPNNISVSGLSIYPNPASDVINVEFSSCNKSVAVLSVMNLLGEELVQIKNSGIGNERTIYRYNPGELGITVNGIYFVKIVLDGNRQFVQKFIYKKD